MSARENYLQLNSNDFELHLINRSLQDGQNECFGVTKESSEIRVEAKKQKTANNMWWAFKIKRAAAS